MEPYHAALRIRTLTEALDRANERVSQLERELVEARRQQYEDKE